MEKLEVGQKIRFSAIDDFTGQETKIVGEVVGDYKKVRETWPEEMGEADENVYAVLTCLPSGLKRGWYAVHISEVLEILKKQHPDDECDCVECRARVEKGGLDYDPSNDDEEFEEHERQVFRDTGIDKEAT